MPPIEILSRQAPPSIRALNFYPLVNFFVAFSYAFFLQFNVLIIVFGGPFQRLTEGLLFLFIPCLFLSVGLGNTVRYGLLYFVVLLIIVASNLLFKTDLEVGQGDYYLTLILLATAVFAFYFAYIAQDEKVIVWFAIGTVLGLIPSIGVLYFQALGGGAASLSAIGLGVPPEFLPERAARLSVVKLGGLWAAGNEAGHIYAVATASALYLALKYRSPFIYIAAYFLLITSFVFTLNRAGMIAPTLGLAYLYYRLGNYFLYAKTALIVLCALVVLVSFTNLSGFDAFTDAIETRFVSDDYAATNANERLDSTMAGLEIAFENPFGIGFASRVDQVLHMTADAEESVHNGFLSLAFQNSLFVPLIYIFSGIYLLAHRRSVQPFFIILFLYTATSMLFEEINLNPFIIFSVSVTVAAAWLHHVRTPKRAVAVAMRSFSVADRQTP